MRSMTGYGRATAPLGAYTLTIQANSVNRKTLDLTTSIPDAWEELEAEVAEAVRRVASRGKVHVTFELTGAASAGALEWDDVAVRDTLARLRRLAEAEGAAWIAAPELVWQVASAHRRVSAPPALDEARDLVRATLDQALRAFAAMRAKEGEALLVDLLGRLATLRRHLEGVTARAPFVAAGYRDTLLKRLREAGLPLDVSDERVLKEVALFADRADITEEITRFRSHLGQFETLLRTEGEVGRKAEFILQEMGREVHTMGAKANDLEIARHVIELKNELERVREQMANVE